MPENDNNRRFPHRQNRDGSFDSICPRCFLTIASAQEEVALERFEAEHRCTSIDEERRNAWALKLPPKSARPGSPASSRGEQKDG